MRDPRLQTWQPPGSREDFIAALFQRFPNSLRLRRGIPPEALPVPTDPVPWYALGRQPQADSPRPTRQLAYAAGDYFVQDAGSLLALAACGADSPGLRGTLICDLCAAPGGKATGLVEAIGDTGFVLANDPIAARLGALQLNLARTGSDRWAVSCLDPAELSRRLGGVFDLVLVDAPCSGQALLSRGRQRIASLSHRQIEHSAARQRRILQAAVELVRPGGRLIYSTCTFAAAENEDQVRWLVDSGAAGPAPIEPLAAYQTDPGCYRLWPHLHACAGSFAASLCITVGKAAPGPGEKSVPGVPPLAELGRWYSGLGQEDRLVATDSVVLGWPADVPPWVEGLARGGPELAHRVGTRWRPAHAGALRRVSSTLPARSIEIDEESVKPLMRGEPIRCAEDGWVVARWRGRPLGWIKADGSTGKNHLPKPARMALE